MRCIENEKNQEEISKSFNDLQRYIPYIVLRLSFQSLEQGATISIETDGNAEDQLLVVGIGNATKEPPTQCKQQSQPKPDLPVQQTTLIIQR